jgi:hypothetical protein
LRHFAFTGTRFTFRGLRVTAGASWYALAFGCFAATLSGAGA